MVTGCPASAPELLNALNAAKPDAQLYAETLQAIKNRSDALRQTAEQGTAKRKGWLRSILTDAGADPQAADLLRRIR